MKIAPFFLLHRTTKKPSHEGSYISSPASRSFFSREPRGSFLIGRQRYRLFLMALSRPSMAVCSSCMRHGGEADGRSYGKGSSFGLPDRSTEK